MSIPVHWIIIIIQVILLIILCIILLTPSVQDIKEYFKRQERDINK